MTIFASAAPLLSPLRSDGKLPLMLPLSSKAKIAIINIHFTILSRMIPRKLQKSRHLFPSSIDNANGAVLKFFRKSKGAAKMHSTLFLFF